MARYVLLRNEQGIEQFHDIEDARKAARSLKELRPEFQIAIQDMDSDYIERYEVRRK